MERRTFLQIVSIASVALLMGELQAQEEMELPFSEAYEDGIQGATKIVKNAKELKLTIPDEPENGLVVPIEVEVETSMSEDDYIEQITVLTTKNRVNRVVTANYTPANGRAYLYINAKLGGTQEVVILARSSGGVVYEKRKKVKVALGGCA